MALQLESAGGYANFFALFKAWTKLGVTYCYQKPHANLQSQTDQSHAKHVQEILQKLFSKETANICIYFS